MKWLKFNKVFNLRVLYLKMQPFPSGWFLLVLTQLEYWRTILYQLSSENANILHTQATDALCHTFIRGTLLLFVSFSYNEIPLSLSMPTPPQLRQLYRLQIAASVMYNKDACYWAHSEDSWQVILSVESLSKLHSLKQSEMKVFIWQRLNSISLPIARAER